MPVQRFQFKERDPIRDTVMHNVTYESWPILLDGEPCNPESGFARDWAMKWRDDPDFPDHPIRDRAGNILLPTDLDQHPADYVDATTVDESWKPDPVQLPFSGPM